MDSARRGKQKGARLDVGVLVPTAPCSAAEYGTADKSCFTVEIFFPGWFCCHILSGMEHCLFT